MPRVRARTRTAGHPVRAETRRSEWLDEEDREEDVPGHGRERHWRRRPPCVAQDEGRHVVRQDHAYAQHRRRDPGRERGAGLMGRPPALCGRATAVGLVVPETARWGGVVRTAFVHGAFAAVGAAGHARFSGRHPAGARRGVPGQETERERDRGEPLEEPHHLPRMRARRDSVNEGHARGKVVVHVIVSRLDTPRRVGLSPSRRVVRCAQRPTRTAIAVFHASLGVSTPSTCSSHGCHFARIVSTSVAVLP
jgi:hypothetical protein